MTDERVNALSNIELLRDFYDGATEESLFEVWERGDARGDSVTPSTYSSSYRGYILATLRRLLGEPGGGALLSIGCGNAVVEAQLAHAGYEVLAVDALDEAVRVASSKGIKVVKADIENWAPSTAWDVVYADGLLGHLYDPANGLASLLARIRSWLTPDRGALVVSNDAPRNGSAAQPAPGVPNFYWLSTNLLEAEAKRAGFGVISSSLFVYDRPLSGSCDRAILMAA